MYATKIAEMMSYREETTWPSMQETESSRSPNESRYEMTEMTLNYSGQGTDERHPFSLAHDPFSLNANGIVSPVIVLFTLVTNILICIVLLKPHMQTPTNTLLVAIAVTDMLTGIWPMPCYVFFYTLRNCFDWVPFNWCAVYFILADYLPTITHTSSIWLTVILAFQRYVCICHFQTGNRLFNHRGVHIAILCVSIAAILTHTNRFFERTFFPIDMASNLYINVTITSCYSELKPLVLHNQDVYFNIYYWFRVIFIHLIPCASLLILNALLITTLRSAQERKIRLVGRQKSDSGHKHSESNSTTLMLIFVVGVFLLVEFPMAILFILYIVGNTFSVMIMDHEHLELATHVSNLVILFSYPINFFIYCAMSRAFRETFVRMIFHRGRSIEASSKTQYLSLTTEAETRAARSSKTDDITQTGC